MTEQERKYRCSECDAEFDEDHYGDVESHEGDTGHYVYPFPEPPTPSLSTATHDHSTEPKVWCTRCQHEHIAAIPSTTYMCDSCGFGQWGLGSAAVHEASTPGHRTYPIAHPTVPLDERPEVPTAAGVLHEVITRIDLARYVNEDTASPWGNAAVLELLAHLREPYTEGGATASVHPPRREQIAEAIAKAEDADYWVSEIQQWEALEQWERDAHPEEYPGMAHEDRESFLRTADAMLALIQRGADAPGGTTTDRQDEPKWNGGADAR